jgi:phosphatidylserine/phosphatidylglycerophosphate/cardiolipin synthase-like enzyme
MFGGAPGYFPIYKGENLAPISSSRSYPARLYATQVGMSLESPLSTPIRYILIVTLSLSLSACLLDVPGTTFTPDPTSSESDGWYTVYFTDPDGQSARSLRGGPDRALAEAIHQARLSVDVAAYDLNLWSLRDALIDAHRRGVSVRLVTESDNLDSEEIGELEEAGIPILGDRRQGLMHNKFVILDRLEVWTGSMNYTINGAYHNDNNLVRVRSNRLADNYTAEFEEMFVDDRFGPGSPGDTPHPSISIDGTQVEVYFSPDDGTASSLIDLIERAQESVYFMAYSFTSDEIAQAMLDRAAVGVTVAGVFDESQVKSNRGGEYDNMVSNGLDVHLDGNPERMHHKVIIIDGRLVITGSYNFSASAEERNDENTLIIHSPVIASQYLAEFERVYAEAKR